MLSAFLYKIFNAELLPIIINDINLKKVQNNCKKISKKGSLVKKEPRKRLVR